MDVSPAKAPLTIHGHIHDHQRPQANIWYMGTPIQHAFGDTMDKTISWISWRPKTGWQEERIDLGLIKRKNIRLRVTEILEWDPPPGFLIKVTIEGSPGELRTLSLPRIEKLKRQGISINIKTKVMVPVTSHIHQSYRARTYLVSLYLALAQNKSKGRILVEWFSQIFGQTNLRAITEVEGSNLNHGLELLLQDSLPAISPQSEIEAVEFPGSLVDSRSSASCTSPLVLSASSTSSLVSSTPSPLSLILSDSSTPSPPSSLILSDSSRLALSPSLASTSNLSTNSSDIGQSVVEPRLSVSAPVTNAGSLKLVLSNSNCLRQQEL